MNIELFKNNEFGTVRVLKDESCEPWFVGVEIAKILGYSNPTKAILMHVDKEDIKKEVIEAPSQNGMMVKTETNLINESGLYSLILKSKLPQAKKFKRWVTSEVLPAIRKHGGYLTPEKVEEVLLNPDTIIQLATKLKKEQQRRKQLENEVIELKPKAFFADVVSNAEDAILVRDFAKLISKGNFSIGEKRLFKWLRENGYLMQNNKPYQRYIDMGIFKVIERSRTDDKGTRIFHTTKITGKGQIYLQRKIYEDFGVKV